MATSYFLTTYILLISALPIHTERQLVDSCSFFSHSPGVFCCIKVHGAFTLTFNKPQLQQAKDNLTVFSDLLVHRIINGHMFTCSQPQTTM